MVYIEAGPFLMGSNEFGFESPLHIATLEAYYIDRYPVTNQDYKAFIDDTGLDAPKDWTDRTCPEGKEDHPVQMVSWYDAVNYAHWAGKRLPTEAEWEKAARGTDGRRWPWGNFFSEDNTICRENSVDLRVTTVSIYEYENGVSPYGVFHMAGNVEEWVEDWFLPHQGCTYSSGCFGEKYKILKGGNYHYTQQYARCAYRRPDRPDSRGFSDFAGPGFRCAMSIIKGGTSGK